MSPTFRLVLLGALLIAALVASVRGDGVSVEALRATFDGLGLMGPVVFAGVYMLAATAMLPAAPFTVGAGLLFGPLVGTVTALVGATLGATGGFLLGRLLGRGAVERFGGRRVAALDRYLSRRGFASLLVVRLVPVFPFNLINLVAGVTALTPRRFVLATALGIIPGTVAYAGLGGTIDDPTSVAFLAAAGLFVVVTVGATVAARRLRRGDSALEPVG